MINLPILFAQATAQNAAGDSGNKWLVLAIILSCVAIFIALIALFGRILAATHPDEKKKPAPAPVQVATPAPVVADVPNAGTGTPSEHVLAVIAAAVATVCGPKARIAGLQTAKPPSVEALMQMWSLEGRRQIYTSHNPRR